MPLCYRAAAPSRVSRGESRARTVSSPKRQARRPSCKMGSRPDDASLARRRSCLAKGGARWKSSRPTRPCWQYSAARSCWSRPDSRRSSWPGSDRPLSARDVVGVARSHLAGRRAGRVSDGQLLSPLETLQVIRLGRLSLRANWAEPEAAVVVVGHGPGSGGHGCSALPVGERPLSGVVRYIPSSERFGLEGIAADLSRFVARMVELDA
jgi:hypothetical protein